jgi:hypothetical protein
MKSRWIQLVGFFVLVGGVSASQAKMPADSAGTDDRGPIRATVAFRSVQVDAASLIVLNAASVSVDIDLVTLTQSSAGKLGFRVGAEWSGRAGFGGERDDYRDLNALLRLTAAGERGRFDLLFGPSSRGRQAWGLASPTEIVAKLGGEGRLNLIGNYFSLFGKVSITEKLIVFGIGLSLGVDTWQ